MILPFNLSGTEVSVIILSSSTNLQLFKLQTLAVSATYGMYVPIVFLASPLD